MDSETNRTTGREAHCLLELCMTKAMSEEVLDANSDDVLDAVLEHGSHIALGPAIALSLKDHSIRLRFDAKIESDADAYRCIADVIEIIEAHTALKVVRLKSAVDAGEPAEPAERTIAAPC